MSSMLYDKNDLNVLPCLHPLSAAHISFEIFLFSLKNTSLFLFYLILALADYLHFSRFLSLYAYLIYRDFSTFFCAHSRDLRRCLSTFFL